MLMMMVVVVVVVVVMSTLNLILKTYGLMMTLMLISYLMVLMLMRPTPAAPSSSIAPAAPLTHKGASS